MQTFLPSGYGFSLDKLANQSAYKSVVEDYELFLKDRADLILLGLAILIGAIVVIIWNKIVRNEGYKDNIECTMVCMMITVPLCIGGAFIYNDYPPTRPQDYYQTALFKFPIKSNLNVQMLNSDQRPKSTTDHKEYPYKIYLNNPKKYEFYLESNSWHWRIDGNYQLYTKKKVCIGEVQDGNFQPANNSLAATFYKYHAYIMKHHLGDKFAKTMTFKPNGKYITINNNVQWVLSNEKDLVLYLYHGSKVKESKINN